MITVKDKNFDVLISQDEIQSVVERTAEIIKKSDEVIILVMANGANWYAQRVFDKIPSLVVDIEYALLKSYSEDKQIDLVAVSLPETKLIQGKTLIILEDIIDSGRTMEYMVRWGKHIAQAKNVYVCPMCVREGIDLAHYNVKNNPFVIASDKWVIGCGFDYDHIGRNLGSIYYMVD